MSNIKRKCMYSGISLVAVLVAVLMCVLFCPPQKTANAAEPVTAVLTYSGSTVTGVDKTNESNIANKTNLKVVIPPSYNGYDITSIANSAFNMNNYSGYTLTSADLSGATNLTTIGSTAFSYCSSLTSITLPNSVATIGASAFFNCSSLTSITLPNSVTTIGISAFRNCSSLASITIPSSVTSIGSSAFQSCSNLASITIPSGVTTISNYLFDGCSSLKTVTIEGRVTTIGSNAFSGCTGLTSITIPSSVTSIGISAFYGCTGLKTVYLPNNATYGTNVFTSVTCPLVAPSESVYTALKSTTNIQNYTNLTYELPVTFYTNLPTEQNAVANQTKLFNYALNYEKTNGIWAANSGYALPTTQKQDYLFNGFYTAQSGGEAITSSTIVANAPYYAQYELLHFTTRNEGGGYAITGFTTTYLNTLDKSNIAIVIRDTYRGTDGTKNVVAIHNEAFDMNNYAGYTFTSIDLSGATNLTTIGSYAFYKCSSLASITLPNSVATIGEYAFAGCSSLASITIPSGVNTINSGLFSECASLNTVTIEGNVTSIGKYAFKDCSSLTSITIPSGVTTISYRLFSGCASLETVTIEGEVTKIGEYAFYNCTKLTNFTIPEKVAAIDGYAFSGCSSLTSITIPSGVTTISDSLFSGCSRLETVTIEGEVTTIGNYAFDSCKGLTGITLPDSVITIGKYAFRYCSSLTSITIPSGVTTISDSLFYECNSLKTVTIKGAVTTIGEYAFIRCSSLTGITLPDSVTTIGGGAFGSCSNLTSITIPSGVTTISDGLFYGCSSLETVTFKSEVNAIDSNAFRDCSSLTGITLPDSVTTIGGGAFDSCSNLTSITIPSGVTTISDSLFYSCSSLKTVEIKGEVTTIGTSAFWGCKGLTGITLPDSVTTIGSSAFRDCTILDNFTIPETVDTIGGSAFWDCSGLASITIPSGVATIGNGAFSGCTGLKTVYLSSNTSTTYGTNVFSGVKCPLVAPSNSVYETLKSGAFSSNKYLTYELPVTFYTNLPTEQNAVTKQTKLFNYTLNYEKNESTGIWAVNGEYALPTAQKDLYLSKGFYTAQSDGTAITSASNVSQAAYYAQYTPYYSTTFDNNGYTITGFTDAYLQSLGDKSNISIVIPATYNDTVNGTKNIVAIGESAFKASNYADCTFTSADLSGATNLTTIGNKAFLDCSSLTSITIPSGVTTISDDLFNGCSSLKTVTIEGRVTEIGYAAFANCSSLASITLPDSVTTIGSNAFSYCSSLTGITLPDSVTTIDGSAFAVCSKLTSIKIPSGVTTISDCLFDGCSSLNTVTIEGNITTIGFSAFRDCSSLTGITLPDSVTTIGSSAFNGCSGLASITIPSSVNSIGYYAFYECSSLASITIPSSVTSIGNDAFNGCTGLKTVYLPNNATYEYNAFAGVTCPLVAPSESVYETLKSDAFSSNNYLTYELTVTFYQNLTADGDSVDKDVLYNFPLNYKKNEGGIWAENSGYELPKPSIDFYTFNGFFTNATGGEGITETATVTQAAYYAQYTKKIISGIEANAAKTVYNAFEDFDKSGLVVKVLFTDGSAPVTITIQDYTVTDGEGLTGDRTFVTLSYTCADGTFTTKVTITVNRIALNMNGVVFEDKTVKDDGQKHTITATNLPNGVSVTYSGTAGYGANGASAVGEYTVTATFKITDELAVNYNVPEPKTAKLTITKVARSIKVTAEPTKTEYTAFEDFDKNGMVVKVVYSDDTEDVITDYTDTDGERLTGDKTFVTLSYTCADGTFTTTVTITVNKKAIDMNGVVFEDKTVKDDGQKHTITATNLPNGVTATYSGTAGYGADGASAVGVYTVTATFKITDELAVNYNVPEPKTAKLTITKVARSIKVTAEPTKIGYNAFENFDTNGMEVKVVYSDDTEDFITDYIVTDGARLTGDKTFVTLSYTCADGTFTVDVAITVNKIAIDISGVVFEDKTVKDDGQNHTITATNLPNGVTVTYSGSEGYGANGASAVGVYTVTATISVSDGINYYISTSETTMTATLTINKAQLIVENEDEDEQDDAIIETEGGFDPALTLDTKDVTEQTSIAAPSKETQVKQVYEVKLLMGEQVVQPSGDVRVKLLLREDLRLDEDLRVYIMTPSGELELVESVREGDYLVFTVGMLDKFAIVGDAPKGMGTGALIAIIVVIVVLLLLALYVGTFFALYRTEIVSGKGWDAFYAPLRMIFKTTKTATAVAAPTTATAKPTVTQMQTQSVDSQTPVPPMKEATAEAEKEEVATEEEKEQAEKEVAAEAEKEETAKEEVEVSAEKATETTETAEAIESAATTEIAETAATEKPKTTTAKKTATKKPKAEVTAEATESAATTETAETAATEKPKVTTAKKTATKKPKAEVTAEATESAATTETAETAATEKPKTTTAKKTTTKKPKAEVTAEATESTATTETAETAATEKPKATTAKKSTKSGTKTTPKKD